MKHRILVATALTLGLALPAAADPTIGLGLSFSFGAGSKVESGVGLRLFSDNKRDSMVGSLGVDYMFTSQSFRPTIGAAYLGKNAYIGGDIGFGLNGGGLDFGLSVGGVNAKKPAAAAPATPLPIIGQTPT